MTELQVRNMIILFHHRFCVLSYALNWEQYSTGHKGMKMKGRTFWHVAFLQHHVCWLSLGQPVYIWYFPSVRNFISLACLWKSLQELGRKFHYLLIFHLSDIIRDCIQISFLRSRLMTVWKVLFFWDRCYMVQMSWKQKWEKIQNEVILCVS